MNRRVLARLTDDEETASFRREQQVAFLVLEAHPKVPVVGNAKNGGQ
jgi:hypothetical protein